jgi:hypothetical protein
MSIRRVSGPLVAGAVILFAADPSWRDKAVPSWTEQDAREVLTASPWAKTGRAMVIPLQTEDMRREGGRLGQEHGIGFDGIADDRPRAQLPKGITDIVKPGDYDMHPASHSIALTLRWESALPIRVAELKSHVQEPPTLETDGYTMAVYGVPGKNVNGDPKILGSRLQGQAFLKREGKKDVKASSVEVFQLQDGLAVVYVFPLSAEITANDRLVQFEARIGRLSIVQSFNLDEMRFQGKLAI